VSESQVQLTVVGQTQLAATAQAVGESAAQLTVVVGLAGSAEAVSESQAEITVEVTAQLVASVSAVSGAVASMSIAVQLLSTVTALAESQGSLAQTQRLVALLEVVAQSTAALLAYVEVPPRGDVALGTALVGGVAVSSESVGATTQSVLVGSVTLED
jgi:hypothetical protein